MPYCILLQICFLLLSSFQQSPRLAGPHSWLVGCDAVKSGRHIPTLPSQGQSFLFVELAKNNGGVTATQTFLEHLFQWWYAVHFICDVFSANKGSPFHWQAFSCITPQRNGTSINICPLDRRSLLGSGRAVKFQFKLDNEEIRKWASQQ
jgi:hypothetical protein